MNHKPTMTRDELFDKVLKHLVDNPNEFWLIDKVCEQMFQFSDNKVIESIVDELIERDWVKPKNNYKYSMEIRHSGQQIIEKYGSYSLFLRSLENAQTKTNREKNIKRILSLIGTGGILWGATFTYLNYNKDELVKEKDQTISRQQVVTDSLQKILVSQQGKIDSLTVSHQTDTTKTK